MARYSISVIVLFSDEKQALKTCVESILNQTSQSYQILLADCGGEEETRKIADDYADNNYIIDKIVPEKIGRAAARNAALEQATGKYVTFVDPSDTILPTFLQEMYAEAELYSADAVFSIVNSSDEKTKQPTEIIYRYLRGKKYSPKDFLTGNLHTGNHLHTMAAFFRRHYAAQVETARDFDDDFIWLPIVVSYSKTFVYLPKALYNEGSHSSIIHRSGRDLMKYRLYAMDSIFVGGNPALSGHLAYGIVKRLNFYRKNSRYYPHIYAQAIHSVRGVLNGTHPLRKDNYLRDDIERFLKDNFCVIPPNVYYADFGNSEITDFDRSCIDSWKRNFVQEESELTLLNEQNCDLKHVPEIQQAYDKKNFSLVNEYFLLETICRTGGVGVAYGLVATAPLAKKLTFSLLLGWQDNNLLFDKIIGCVAGDKYAQKILSAFMTRVRNGETENVLKLAINDTILPLCKDAGGRGMILDETVGIFSPLIFVTNLATDGNVSEYVPHGFEELYMQGYKVVTDAAIRQSRQLIEASLKEDIERLRRFNKDYT